MKLVGSRLRRIERKGPCVCRPTRSHRFWEVHCVKRLDYLPCNFWNKRLDVDECACVSSRFLSSSPAIKFLISHTVSGLIRRKPSNSAKNRRLGDKGWGVMKCLA